MAQTLAEVVRTLREQAMLSQEELATRSGLSVSTVRGLEAGRIRRPRHTSVRQLADALGTSPADRDRLHATARQELHGHAGDADVGESDRPAPGSGQVSPMVVPAQLPAALAGFAGRAEAVRALDAMLDAAGCDPTAAVVAIAGTAGIGKTTLAVHWAHRVAHRFSDGQLYVNLRGFSAEAAMDPGEAVRGFLDALGVRPDRIPVSLDGQVGLYRSLLAGRRMLIVLDNARDCEQVRPLLPGAPGCLVIVTSRYPLSGLVATDGAQLLRLGLLTDADARQLLERRLGQQRVEPEPEAVSELIARCAGLPLGLAIVAARAATNGFPLPVLAAQLRESAGRLDVFASTDTASDLRAVLSWSYERLSDSAAGLFRLLGLSVGPDIAVPAVASLAGAVPAQVRPLLAELNRALLLVEHVPGRYAFHDLLRTYAAELARDREPEPDRRAALTRLLDHYLHTAYAAARQLSPQQPVEQLTAPSRGVTPEAIDGQPQAIEWFAVERGSLLAAVELAVHEGLDGHTWQLARVVAEFLTRQGHWRDQLATDQAALAVATRRGDRSGQALAHRSIARACLMMGQYEQASSHFQAALEQHGKLGDGAGQGVVHLGLARVAELQERLLEALEHSRRALELLPESDPHRGSRAAALNAVGWYAARLGYHEQALDHCRRALALAKQIGYRHFQAAIWDSLGFTHRQQGDHREAIACCRQALELYREAGDRYNEADVLTHLGDTYQATGDPAAARDAWSAAVEILDKLDHPDAGRVRERLAAIAPAEPERGDCGG